MVRQSCWFDPDWELFLIIMKNPLFLVRNSGFFIYINNIVLLKSIDATNCLQLTVVAEICSGLLETISVILRL